MLERMRADGGVDKAVSKDTPTRAAQRYKNLTSEKTGQWNPHGSLANWFNTKQKASGKWAKYHDMAAEKKRDSDRVAGMQIGGNRNEIYVQAIVHKNGQDSWEDA